MDVLFIFVWLIPLILATVIGQGKDRTGFGFVLGFLLGIFGVLIIALMPAAGYPCPRCRGTVRRGASVCPHCRSDLLAANSEVVAP